KKLAEHPLVGEASGVGLIGAVQLVASKRPKVMFEAVKGVGAFCAKRCQEHGLIVRALFCDRVAVCPPLVITQSQIDELRDGLRRGLDDTMAMAREQGLAAVA